MKLGIDNIKDYKNIFKGKRIGLITNATGINSDFRSTIEVLNEFGDLKALYAPEHGVRGNIQAGEKVDNYVDEETSLMVYSLYGNNRKPSYEILKDIDILAFDIQDVGSRFYTYIYTMAYAMESCSEFNKEFVVFDRPNPLGGEVVEGNKLSLEFKSFIGLYPIPQRYGLTIGELALLFNKEFNINCNLHVVKMDGWHRSDYFDDTKLPWVMPSPNMPSIDTALVYNGTCIFEGTNISEGRGTVKPFELIGAPWIDGFKLSNMMNDLKLKGVYFRPAYFTPTFSKHQGKLCGGVQVHVTDRNKFKAVECGMNLLYAIKELSGENFQYIRWTDIGDKYTIDYNTGCNYVRLGNYNLKEILNMWEKEANEFNEVKKKYHIYE